MKRWIPVVLAVVGFSLGVWAQQRVISNQGRPGAEGAWPVSLSGPISFSGTVNSVPPTCTTLSHKVSSVTTASSNCPTSNLASRREVVICSSLENVGSPLLKIRTDGVAPVMGTANPGDVLLPGDCVKYLLNASTSAQCISNSASGVAVHTYECV